MMSHEECIEYIQDNELVFSVGNCYGNLSLKYESKGYHWSVENYDGNYWDVIPYYLGDALVNYYCENKD